MLAVSPLRIKNEGENSAMDEGTAVFAALPSAGSDDFPDLLDTIDFDDLFMGINVDGDVLPDLEMDPEILAEFSSVTGHDDEYNSDMNVNAATGSLASSGDRHGQQLSDDIGCNNDDSTMKDEKEGAASDLGSGSTSSLIQGDEIVSKRDDPPCPKRADNSNSSSKGRKSSSSSAKNPPGKRKVKVDWTPELHRRFVQAVEQLGVDKAVPSRILELMGIDCLTRHNIASHLQKYRSHRKHLLAREAEAANWSQRRQMYGTAAVAGGGLGKRGVNPWIAPTMGFPPVTPRHPHPPPPPHFRPLHVWGHPSVDQSFMQMWPKHLAPSPSPPHGWPPVHPLPPPSADPSFWHSHHPYVQVPPSPTPGFAPHLPPTRYPTSQPVPGILPPPVAMYKIDPGLGVPPPMQAGQALPQPPSDIHPSKESVDAAIGDVLTKPWLPLPLGLKPPSIDSVMVELQRKGIPRVPPTNSA